MTEDHSEASIERFPQSSCKKVFIQRNQVDSFHKFNGTQVFILPQSENISVTNGRVVASFCMSVYLSIQYRVAVRLGYVQLIYRCTCCRYLNNQNNLNLIITMMYKIITKHLIVNYFCTVTAQTVWNKSKHIQGKRVFCLYLIFCKEIRVNHPPPSRVHQKNKKKTVFEKLQA